MNENKSAPVDVLAVMKEYALVQRGEHPAWKGDRCENGDFFLWQFAHDMPEAAQVMADDLAANVTDYSEETGLSPDRIRYAVNRLREKLARDRAALDRCTPQP